MVTDVRKQEREQDQAQRQTRIRDAMRDFFQHGLKQVQAKQARRQDTPETLFNSTTQRTASSHE